jgi:hypothetical protein
MPKLFGLDIAGLVAKAMGKGFLPVTLISQRPWDRQAGSLSSGTNPTTTAHSARGILSDYSETSIDGTIIQTGDRKVLILGDTIRPPVVPKIGDMVFIEDFEGTIVNVNRDPAAATYTCQAR